MALAFAAQAGLGCTVGPELTAARDGSLRDARAPDAAVEIPVGPRLIWPSAGLAGVPVNLDRVYAAPGEGDPVLVGPDGQPIVARVVEVPGRCGREPRCFALLLEQPLAPGIRVSLANAPAQTFTTSSSRDDVRPWLSEPIIRVSDRCVLVEVDTDEPVLAFAHLIGVSATPSYALPGARKHLIGVALPSRLAGDDALMAEVVVRDLAGNETRSVTVVVPPPANLARVHITEVLANPAGAEPTQEWIELTNLGAPIDVRELELAISGTIDVLPPAILGTGERAIVVPKAYREDAGEDPPPDARARVLRIGDTALGRSGLANGGERIELRDRAGNLISSFGAFFDTSGTGWNGRSVERISFTGCDVPANVAPNGDGRSTPGSRNSVER